MTSIELKKLSPCGHRRLSLIFLLSMRSKTRTTDYRYSRGKGKVVCMSVPQGFLKDFLSRDFSNLHKLGKSPGLSSSLRHE